MDVSLFPCALVCAMNIEQQQRQGNYAVQWGEAEVYNLGPGMEARENDSEDESREQDLD